MLLKPMNHWKNQIIFTYVALVEPKPLQFLKKNHCWLKQFWCFDFTFAKFCVDVDLGWKSDVDCTLEGLHFTRALPNFPPWQAPLILKDLLAMDRVDILDNNITISVVIA